MSKSLISILVLSGLGVYVSGVLVAESAVFAVSGEMGCVAGNTGCLKAAQSAFSKIGDTPIAVFGLGYYITALLMSLALLFWKNLNSDALRKTFFIGAFFSLIYSIFLGGVSIVNKFFCPYCAALYGINLLLFIATFISFPKSDLSKLQAVIKTPKTTAFWAVALVYFIAIPSAKSIYLKQVSFERNQLASKTENAPLSGEALTTALSEQKNKAKEQIDAQKPTENTEQTKQAEPPALHSFEMLNRPIRGEKSSPLTVVEFSDFECPYCQKFGLSLKEALASAPGKFKYVFKHFPLDKKCNPSIKSDFHQHACDAAYAMVCAGKENKEWEMHDLIFDNQKTLNAGSFENFATELGMDLSGFRNCLKSPSTLETVAQDVQEGIKANIQGTPSVYVNGFQMAPELDGKKLGKLLSTIGEQMK